MECTPVKYSARGLLSATVIFAGITIAVSLLVGGCSPPSQPVATSSSNGTSAGATTNTPATTGSTNPPVNNAAPNSTASTTNGDTAAAAQTAADDPHAIGKQVFQANCRKCHKLDALADSSSGGSPGGPGGAGGPGGFGGPGGRGGPGGGGFGQRAPDLSKVGADPKHTAEWIAAYIGNPKSENPQARMPPFEGKITDEDLKALSEFLASLKE